MPRLLRIFGRKGAGVAPDAPIGSPVSLADADDIAANAVAIEDAPDTATVSAPPPEDPGSASLNPDRVTDDPAEPTRSDDVPADEHTAPTKAEESRVGLDLADDVPADEHAVTAPEIPADTPSDALIAERRGQPVSKTLIGGEEADLVPLIPDTEIDSHESNDLDEESMASATVDALKNACEVMVKRVNTLRTQHDGTQIVAGLIALVSELDIRYANDWGIVRRNGLEDVLIEVRQTVVEGDRFILESLENGRGGLTADVFLRDLRTIAPSDRPRMITAYVGFLVFVIKCVLRQYLRPLEADEMRIRDLSRRVDYLIDGIRDTLLARVNGLSRLS